MMHLLKQYFLPYLNYLGQNSPQYSFISDSRPTAVNNDSLLSVYSSVF